MNANEVKTAKAKIRAHYHLDRPVTDAELDAELAMLRRHNAAGTCDDMNERLLCSLATGKHPIEFD